MWRDEITKLSQLDFAEEFNADYKKRSKDDAKDSGLHILKELPLTEDGRRRSTADWEGSSGFDSRHTRGPDDYCSSEERHEVSNDIFKTRAQGRGLWRR